MRDAVIIVGLGGERDNVAGFGVEIAGRFGDLDGGRLVGGAGEDEIAEGAAVDAPFSSGKRARVRLLPSLMRRA